MQLTTTFFRSCILFLTLAGHENLSGWSMSPSKATITPEKPQIFFTFTSTESDTDPAAIEIQVSNRFLDINGNERLEPNNNNFFIYPSQIILNPGETKTVRVIWKGNGSEPLLEEKAFRITAESLPVELPIEIAPSENQQRNINFAIRLGTQYISSLYVAPKSANDNVICSNASLQKEGEENFIQMELQNLGNKHRFFQKLSLVIKCGEETITVPAEDLASVINQGINIFPKHSRLIRFPLTTAIPDNEKITISLNLD